MDAVAWKIAINTLSSIMSFKHNEWKREKARCDDQNKQWYAYVLSRKHIASCLMKCHKHILAG